MSTVGLAPNGSREGIAVNTRFVAGLLAFGVLGARVARGRSHARRALLWTPPGGDYHDGPLAYRTIGKGSPTFVLLHGLAGSGQYWGGAYDELSRHGCVVVPDLLGFGRSPKVTGDYGLPEHVDAILGCLDDLDVRRPVVFVTHSFGGIVALAVAARRASTVAGIVAFGPPWYADRVRAGDRLAQMGPMARLFALDPVWGRRVCGFACSHPRLSARLAVAARPDLPPEVARDGLQHNWSSYRGSLGVIESAPVPGLMDSVSVPVRVVIGDDDAIPDRAYLQSRLEDGQLEDLQIWPGHHDLPMTAPARAASHVRTAYRDWLSVLG